MIQAEDGEGPGAPNAHHVDGSRVRRSDAYFTADNQVERRASHRAPRHRCTSADETTQRGIPAVAGNHDARADPARRRAGAVNQQLGPVYVYRPAVGCAYLCASHKSITENCGGMCPQAFDQSFTAMRDRIRPRRIRHGQPVTATPVCITIDKSVIRNPSRRVVQAADAQAQQKRQSVGLNHLAMESAGGRLFALYQQDVDTFAAQGGRRGDSRNACSDDDDVRLRCAHV
ncbi:hypothetical protein POL72_45605 [Sorangium sp. wiwo2]|uniref:Transposase n=1 Tax=Sorangium atrum TaxID=2995308 RepID=A0ABT5CF43_9BACT|nr:hypothetical protein [Sorangium aterium]MDC0685076.1 hypothetical protein [Sorangium aterium]